MRRLMLLVTLLAGGVLGRASAVTVQTTSYHDRGITASGVRSQPGTAALSRDLLAQIPHGSVIRLTRLSGPQCGGFATVPLLVTDTTAARLRRTVDVWLPTREQSRGWGRCKAQLQIIRLGVQK